MKFYHLPDGRDLPEGQAFELGGIRYPGNWLSLASPETLTSLGISTTTLPDPGYVPSSITKFQLLIQLKRVGLITKDEAIAAAAGGIPAGVATYLATLPSQDLRDEAVITWSASSTIERNHPLVLALAASAGLTSEQLDAFFVSAAQI